MWQLDGVFIYWCLAHFHWRNKQGEQIYHRWDDIWHFCFLPRKLSYSHLSWPAETFHWAFLLRHPHFICIILSNDLWKWSISNMIFYYSYLLAMHFTCPASFLTWLWCLSNFGHKINCYLLCSSVRILDPQYCCRQCNITFDLFCLPQLISFWLWLLPPWLKKH